MTILSFIIFIIITVLVMTKDLSFEENIFDYLQSHSNNVIKIIMYIMTTMGEWYIFLSLVIIMFFFVKKKYMIMIIINLLLSFGLNNLLKIIFVRERPIYKLINARSYSYPSGHSMVSFAFYGLLIYLIYKLYNGKYKKVFISLLSLLILLIGLSRIYFGVHYLTDVIGAYTFSFGYLLIFIYVIKRREYV